MVQSFTIHDIIAIKSLTISVCMNFAETIQRFILFNILIQNWLIVFEKEASFYPYPELEVLYEMFFETLP